MAKMIKTKEEIDLGLVEMTTSEEITVPQIKVYKVKKSATLPVYATLGSAAADVFCDLNGHQNINIFYENGIKTPRPPNTTPDGEEYVIIPPYHRAQIPTNLIFDIPLGYKLLIYPRSGLSLIRGLGLSNSVGVIDNDYVDSLYILITNTTGNAQIIKSGERIAQVELVPYTQAEFTETLDPILHKTDRVGGLGHTGT